jgi:methionine aminopeptidase
MYSYYSKEEIKILREGGKKLAWILEELGKFLKSGIVVDEIETKSRELIAEVGGTAATIGYTPK